MAAHVEHSGVVVAIEGDKARVRFMRSSACKSCGACLTVGEKEMETLVDNNLNAVVGDRVLVQLSASSLLIASVLCYVLPLCALLIGIWLGMPLGDFYALLFGVVGCVIVFLLLRIVDKRAIRSRRFIPTMTKIIKED